jgi:hypothetical protein
MKERISMKKEYEKRRKIIRRCIEDGINEISFIANKIGLKQSGTEYFIRNHMKAAMCYTKRGKSYVGINGMRINIQKKRGVLRTILDFFF